MFVKFQIGPDFTSTSVYMYHPNCQEDCPQACDNGWLYWSGSDWTNDQYFNIQCGKTSIFFLRNS